MLVLIKQHTAGTNFQSNLQTDNAQMNEARNGIQSTYGLVLVTQLFFSVR